MRAAPVFLLPLALLVPGGCLPTSSSQDTASPPSAIQNTSETWISLVDASRIGRWEFLAFGGREAFETGEQQLAVEAGYPLSGFRYVAGDFPVCDYQLELDARKIDGTDFFCLLTFPVQDQFCSLVVGGWGGTVTGISCVNQRDASDNSTTSARKYEYDRWYHIRIRVTADRLQCWIDDQSVVDLPLAGVELSVRADVDDTRPLGLCSFATAAAWKNIRYKRLP
jgi:hypothetical protein